MMDFDTARDITLAGEDTGWHGPSHTAPIAPHIDRLPRHTCLSRPWVTPCEACDIIHEVQLEREEC